MANSNHRLTDFIELFIVLAIIFLIMAIYVPVAIWEEESIYEKKSQFRMENIYNLESFFSRLTEEYAEDGLWAMNVVNAVKDSVTADSSYLGEQTLSFKGQKITVNIPEGFDLDYDTTFGFQKFKRDTTIDTTVTLVMWSNELSRNDTVYVQKKSVPALLEDEDFRSVLNEQPFELVEVVSYHDTYMPDSSFFLCPVTNKPYELTVSEDGFTVASPILDVYKETRYIVFAFKAQNHGFIQDGVLSWER
ncbi:MAG: hypothetical protein V3W20_01100 [Candidatus Neomarinimicrobiota bacterium]